MGVVRQPGLDVKRRVSIRRVWAWKCNRGLGLGMPGLEGDEAQGEGPCELGLDGTIRCCRAQPCLHRAEPFGMPAEQRALGVQECHERPIRALLVLDDGSVLSASDDGEACLAS